MVTAAEGAEEFYDYGNEARYENIEQARARDKKLRDAYLGHHRYFIVDNNHKNFNEKIRKTIELVQSILGLPTSHSSFKKYLVNKGNLLEDHSNLVVPDGGLVTQSKIKETFLPCSNSIDDINVDKLSICVREREKNGSKIYTYDKRYIMGDQRI